MVIGFNKQFVPKIKSGTKTHTIRHDQHNRWKVGMKMHMATGVRTKNYKCFKVEKCVSIQKIEFRWTVHNKGLGSEAYGVKVFIDNKDFTNDSNIIDELAIADGFENRHEFLSWKGWYRKNFTGKILHWSDKKY